MKTFVGAVLMSVGVFLTVCGVFAEEAPKPQGPAPTPVRVARVTEKMVSDQVALIGTAEAVAKSMVAAEVSGLVAFYPVQEGDFVKKGDLLARLKSTDLELRLKGMRASRDSIAANLENARRELTRLSELKRSKSIAETQYDNALYNHRALSKRLLQSEAEIEQLEYEIRQKNVLAPFAGFISREHTQVGQWIHAGGPVVTLLDLSRIHVTVDVPERYAVTLSRQSEVSVTVSSISNGRIPGRISAVMPEGDATSRTFPVRIRLDNPQLRIKSGMEAVVIFNLQEKKKALLVPKDAVVTAGNERLVFAVVAGRAVPMDVRIMGYYDGAVAVAGGLTPGDAVVVRGNERLRPGQPVAVQP